MIYDYFGDDELLIVNGGPVELLNVLEAGLVRTHQIAGAVVTEPDATRIYSVQVLDQLIDDLVAQRLSRDSLVEQLTAYPYATSVARRASDAPGVVIENGHIIGAWLIAPPPRIRRRRRWRSIDEQTADASKGAEGEGGVETIRRTPHLDSPMEIPTAPGSSFPISVFTDQQDFAEGEVGEGVDVETPAGVDHVDIDVDILVTKHFRIDGRRSGVLTIERDIERSKPLSFTVTVADDAPDGTAGIQAIFSHRARPCGQVGRAWHWKADHATAETAAARPESTVSLPVYTEARRPDLTVVVAAPVNDGINYQCKVSTDLIDGYDGDTWVPWGVPAGGYQFVSTLLAGIADHGASGKARLRALAEAGYEVWDAAPPNFRDVLWALVDAGKRPANIYIASVEPTMPWELMIPTRHDGRFPDELEPLGVEFAVGRWSRSDGGAPPPKASVTKSYIVAPRYSGDRALDTAGELEFVESRLNGQLVSPATIDHLDDWFETNDASLLHFACHGAADIENDDAIYLDQEEVLRSRTLKTMRGLKAMCKEHRPIVFVNACNTGKLTPSLAGGAGFPRAFGDIGARAIIAPLWPVDDGLAHDVAIELYSEGLKPGAPPIAELLRRIRKRAYDQLNADTYAAYSFFGDPHMTLV